jgi:membrane fusion protein, multidrug efflux system
MQRLEPDQTMPAAGDARHARRHGVQQLATADFAVTAEATDRPTGPDAVVERRGRSGSVIEASRPEVAAAPGTAVASPAAAAAAAAAAPPRRRWPRRLLLALGVAAALGGALWLYLSGGRYVDEDDAYVQARDVAISPQVSGQVLRVAVRENQEVRAGDLLFEIDPEPFRIARDGAAAQLDAARNQLASLVETWRAQQAQLPQAEANLAYAQRTFDRDQDLTQRGFAPQSQLDADRRDLRGAEASLASLREQVASVLAQLGGHPELPIEQQASYRQAQANLDTAARNLRLTAVTAPFAGVATKVDGVQPGLFLNAGQPAMTVVSRRDVWVEANVRETDLTHLEVGDPAAVAVDAYPGIALRGRVRSIGPASGAVFALLPPQNASGNWVKVVQRVPVEVALDLPPDAPVLRAGMSATVTIDTGHERSLAALWRAITPW